MKRKKEQRKETLSSANTIIEQFVVDQVESIFTCSICNSDISPTVLLTLTRASSWERCTLARMESPLETLLGLSSLRNINKSSFQNEFLSPLFLSSRKNASDNVNCSYKTLKINNQCKLWQKIFYHSSLKSLLLRFPR